MLTRDCVGGPVFQLPRVVQDSGMWRTSADDDAPTDGLSVSLAGVEALEERGEVVVGNGGNDGADGLRAPLAEDVEHSIRGLRCCRFGGMVIRWWAHAADRPRRSRHGNRAPTRVWRDVTTHPM